MKIIILMGIAFIVFGIASLVNGGISYTKREKVIDLGSIEATAKRDKTISVSPLFAVMALLGGVSLIIIPLATKNVKV